MPFPLEEHTIFLTLAGSHAHGTARDGSDVDLRGVCIAPLRQRVSLFESFEQFEGDLPHGLRSRISETLGSHPTAGPSRAEKVECVVYDIAKLVQLCSVANPNALEILFAEEGDWLIETPAWRRLHRQRSLFLTRRVRQTFSGYAMAQLKRIRTHRAWLLDPPKRKPMREDFGLLASSSGLSRDDQNRLEKSLHEKIRAYGIDEIELPKSLRIALKERVDELHRDVLQTDEAGAEDRWRAVAARSMSLAPETLATLNAERRYRSALKHWEAFQSWQRERNEKRAALEREHGYDTKHAMHLVRLMRMGLEALRSGSLQVRRSDAAELSAIRDGRWSFDELVSIAGSLQREMEAAEASSPLPLDIDRDRIDALTYALIVEPTS
ncbi:MAG: nucleotidyltransferase domain-containing protein [Planctomycetota bacterium]